MSRTDELKLNSDMTLQGAEFTDRLAATPVVVRKTIEADATGGLAVTIPYDMYLIDAIVQCTTASASGTVTVKRGSTAVTDAMICAVDHVVVRAGTIDNAEASIATSDSITVVTHGAADRGTVYLIGMRY